MQQLVARVDIKQYVHLTIFHKGRVIGLVRCMPSVIDGIILLEHTNLLPTLGKCRADCS